LSIAARDCFLAVANNVIQNVHFVYDVHLNPKKHYWKPISVCNECGHEEKGGYKGKISDEEFLKQQALTIRK